MEEKKLNQNQNPVFVIFKVFWKILGVVIYALCADDKQRRTRGSKTTHDMIVDLGNQDPNLLDSNQSKKN